MDAWKFAFLLMFMVVLMIGKFATLPSEHMDFKRTYDPAERAFQACEDACQEHKGVASIQLLVRPWCTCTDGVAYD